MIRPYGIAVAQGSQGFSGFVNQPVNGPLDTNKFPLSMPYHSYGTLVGIKPTPIQLYPSQEPINSDMNLSARAQYLRATAISNVRRAIEIAQAKASPPITKVCYSTQRHIPVSTHVNYIAPISGGQRVDILKSIAVGKSAYKVGLPAYDPISTKNYYPSGTRSTLHRVRNGGTCAPKKKGSIYNYSLTQPGICAWGSAPRSNY